MHYIESGSGTPLVLLHAFPVDARMWNGVRALLDDQVRVITPDQRGLGESPLNGATASSGGGAAEPDLSLAAADIVALLDMLDLRQVVLGGCSMGGYVAMAVLRAAPERIAGLLLADTKAVADNPEQRDTRLTAADRAERDGTEGWLPDNTLPNVLGRTTHDQRPDVVAAVRNLIETQSPDGVAWAQRAMANRPDSSDVLRGFDGPTLVVVGDEDTLTPPEAASELASTVPQAELAILPGVGHLSAVENPDAFADVVRPWLTRFA